MERITITIDIETTTKLDKICKSMERTTSDTIRHLIKEYELND